METTRLLRLSDVVEKSIEDAIAACSSVAEISALSRSLLERHPELRFETDSLTEILVTRATSRGLAIRFDRS